LDCTKAIPGAKQAYRELENGQYGDCKLDSCLDNYEKVGNECVPNTESCPADTLTVLNAISGTRVWGGSAWDGCVIKECKSGFELYNNKCHETTASCDIQNAKVAQQDFVNGSYGACYVVECETNYQPNADKTECEPKTVACTGTTLPANATAGTRTWQGTDWSECEITKCVDDYDLVDNKCVKKG
jgi:hypothetical protein